MSALREEDLLRWRLPSFQRKLDRARERVRHALQESAAPYIALSGGKDSLVVAALVAEQRPGADAVFCDDELELPVTVPYLRQLAAYLGLKLRIGRCYSMAPVGWIVPWTDKPFFRPPEPDMEDWGASVKAAALRIGYDGTFVGLRAAEAMIRRLNLQKRGMQYGTNDGMQHCQPIATWAVQDVWAVIAGMGLPYNPAYDDLAAAGIKREQQRIGALPLSPGWILQQTWPQLHRRLIARYGERW